MQDHRGMEEEEREELEHHSDRRSQTKRMTLQAPKGGWWFEVGRDERL